MENDRQPPFWTAAAKKVEEPFDSEGALNARRSFYRGFSLERLRQRIEGFWRLPLNDPELDIVQAVRAVLSQDPSGKSVASYAWYEVPVGAIMWRARCMGESLNSDTVALSDLWEPPAHRVSKARFNADGEPLLYACVDEPLGALAEARVTTPGKKFILVGYCVKRPMPLLSIGAVRPDVRLSPRERGIESEISGFLADVLSIPESEVDGVYGLTQRVLREVFPFEDGWHCGWIYESTLQGGLANVAIEPKCAHDRMDVWWVVAGSVESLPNGEQGVSLGWLSDSGPGQGAPLRWAPGGEAAGIEQYFDQLPVSYSRRIAVRLWRFRAAIERRFDMARRGIFRRQLYGTRKRNARR